MQSPIGIKNNSHNQYVAYLDVLGFSIITEKFDTKKLEDYFSTVLKAFEVFNYDKKNLKLLVISDSIIIIANDSEADFRKLLTAIQSLQTYLSYKNIWLRGGISYGNVCYIRHHNIIVGQGYVKAYLLERDYAVYPRVIIDPLIITKIAEDQSGFVRKFNSEKKVDGKTKEPNVERKLIHDYGGKFFRSTQDDAIFVSYSHRIVYDCCKKTSSKKSLNIIYKNIKEGLYSNQKIYPKYLWLKKYFIETLHEYWCETDDSNDQKKNKKFFLEWKNKFGQL